jgi:hypothetical protein
MQDLRDTRIEPLITKFYRGLRANYHFIPYLSARYRGRGGAVQEGQIAGGSRVLWLGHGGEKDVATNYKFL